MHRTLLIVATAAALSSAACGHDYWMQPDRFVVPAGKPVSVRLLVGDGLKDAIERPYQAQATVRFDLISRNAARDLKKSSVAGRKPLLKLSTVPAGSHWLAMERGTQHITLSPEKFAKYLEHEHLHEILKARKDAGETKKPGTERYSRYLKCLIRSGDRQDDVWKQVVGLRLEIVPATNPAELKPGEKFRVRVLFDGKPLRDAAVFCHSRTATGKVESQAARTNDKGAAPFTTRGSGTHVVRLVHMRRCADSAKADWESFWGAMTFGVQ